MNPRTNGFAGALKEIVWLAGYPASGGIKTQIAVANLLYGAITSVTDLDAKVRCLTLSPVVAPDPLNRQAECIFTHFPPTHHLLAPHRTLGVIYVVRHPLDVCISSSRYNLPFDVDYRHASDDEIEAKRRQNIDFFMTHGFHLRYIGYGYGGWSGHILGWTEFAQRNKVPLLLVKFEDLRDSARDVITALGNFLNVAVDEERFALIQHDYSLEFGREMEEGAIKEKQPCRYYKPAFEPAYQRGWRFHFSGGSNYGKDQLTDAQRQHARHLFGPVAERLGYEI